MFYTIILQYRTNSSFFSLEVVCFTLSYCNTETTLLFVCFHLKLCVLHYRTAIQQQFRSFFHLKLCFLHYRTAIQKQLCCIYLFSLEVVCFTLSYCNTETTLLFFHLKLCDLHYRTAIQKQLCCCFLFFPHLKCVLHYRTAIQKQFRSFFSLEVVCFTLSYCKTETTLIFFSHLKLCVFRYHASTRKQRSRLWCLIIPVMWRVLLVVIQSIFSWGFYCNRGLAEVWEEN